MCCDELDVWSGWFVDGERSDLGWRKVGDKYRDARQSMQARSIATSRVLGFASRLSFGAIAQSGCTNTTIFKTEIHFTFTFTTRVSEYEKWKRSKSNILNSSQLSEYSQWQRWENRRCDHRMHLGNVFSDWSAPLMHDRIRGCVSTHFDTNPGSPYAPNGWSCLQLGTIR